MGFGWAVMIPMLIVASGTIVRLIIANLSGGSLNLHIVGTIAVKSLPWAFFVAALSAGSSSLVGNRSLVTKIYFAREVLPLSALCAVGFDTLIGFVVLAVVLPFLGAKLGLPLLWVPILALMLFAFAHACALLFSSANLFFRDIRYLVQVITMFGVFFTPVLFEPEMLGDLGSKLIMLNPVAPIVDGLRLAVMEGHNLLTPLVSEQGTLLWTPWYLAYSTVWTVGGLVTASLLFHRLEFLFAEYA